MAKIDPFDVLTARGGRPAAGASRARARVPASDDSRKCGVVGLARWVTGPDVEMWGSGREELVASRWVVLSASLLAEVCGGAMYAFPVYSEQLRVSLGYAQWQISSLALASNIGFFCNVPSGIVQDRWGTRATVCCGIVLNFVGYFLLYLVATGTIVVPYPAVFGVSVLWGNGAGWFDTAVMSVNMVNFAEKRGIVVGMIKAFFGLSSALISLLYFGFFNAMGAPSNAQNFILFLAVGLSAIGLLVLPALNRTPPPLPEALSNGSAQTRLLLAYGNVVLLAALLALTSLASADILGSGLLPELPPSRYRIICAVVGTVYCCFFLLPVGAGPVVYSAVQPALRGCGGGEGGDSCVGCCCCSVSSTVESRARRNSLQVGAGPEILVAAVDANATKQGGSAVGRSLGLLDALCMSRFWLLAMAMFCAMGCGLVLLNNAAQVAESLGGGERGTAALFVMIMSTTNCVGRMMWGLGSDLMVRRGVDRTAFLTLSVGAMSIGMGMMAVADYDLLFAASAVVGLAYGSLWGVVPVLIVELFGPESFGTLYTTLSAAVAASSFVLATALTGGIYEQHVRPDSCECVGGSGGDYPGQYVLALPSGSATPSFLSLSLWLRCAAYTFLGAGTCEGEAQPWCEEERQSAGGICPLPEGCALTAADPPCVGRVCFQMTFEICTGVSLLGTLFALALQLTNRDRYREVRERLAAADGDNDARGACAGEEQGTTSEKVALLGQQAGKSWHT